MHRTPIGAHAEQHPPPPAGLPPRRPVLALGMPRKRVLHGVRQQVLHYLRDAVRIGLGLQHLALNANLEEAVGRLERRVLRGGADERGRVDALPRELQPARFEAREVHQVADDPAQAMPPAIPRWVDFVVVVVAMGISPFSWLWVKKRIGE
jgi:hypothetical protein